MKRIYRRSGRGGGSFKPTRVWSDVSTSAVFAGITGTSQAILISLESPTNLSNLGADPPEDLTILRVVGDLNVNLTGGSGAFRLGLIVQDRTWTANALPADDMDKRILWTRQYSQPKSTTVASSWGSPDWFLTTDGTVEHVSQSVAGHIDISPKVKVEAGKALYLVAWEAINGAALTVSAQTLRVLYQRSGRR